MPESDLPDIPNRLTTDFAESFDVIVAGYGLAGAAGAIAAADHGARVLLIEKAPIPGGISICAGGGIRITRKPAEALKYLKATNNDTTPDDVLETFAHGMTEIETFMRGLAEVNGAKIELLDRPANYDLPGYDSLSYLEVAEVPGFDIAETYPHMRGLRLGPNLFKLMNDSIDARDIEVRFSTPAVRLITNETGEVRGLWVRDPDGNLKAIAARRGVILACGGFEADPELQSQHWQIRPVRPVATTSNTGDGLRMAQDVGAALWHMWHMHGSYGFKHPDPDCPLGIRVKHLPGWIPNVQASAVPMAWILLDKSGKRFMNEYPPYLQDTGSRPLEAFNAASKSFPRIPAFMIADEKTRKMYPLGSPVSNDAGVAPMTWSADNGEEIERGILKQVNGFEELAALIGCDATAVQETLDAWNAACALKTDPDFGRPAESMVPIKTPPFVVGEIWPVVSNTQGGPRHDARQRILNAYHEPIPRLYEAGEIGSIFGFLYFSGANLAECIVGGRIAAREATALAPWA
ncbi:MAG: FAD-dependent oxidoreductase [Rhodospirillales bacterium]